MGTSKSSSGPGSGTPFVPPWVQDINAPPAEGPTDRPKQPDDPEQQIPQLPPVPSPARRFKMARTALSAFARSANSEDLKKGLGHYVRTGGGGSAMATRRMGGTARVAGNLYSTLSNFSQKSVADESLEPRKLEGKTARQIGDILIESICPTNGTQDAEASRNSLHQAISSALEGDPNLDLTSLNEDQASLITQNFVAYDICARIELDVGKSILDNAPDYITAAKRIAELNGYVHQVVALKFREGPQLRKNASPAKIGQLIQATIRQVFEVFEDYLN